MKWRFRKALFFGAPRMFVYPLPIHHPLNNSTLSLNLTHPFNRCGTGRIDGVHWVPAIATADVNLISKFAQRQTEGLPVRFHVVFLSQR